LQASLPWSDDTGTLSCFVKITVSININALFQSQVWARGLGQGPKDLPDLPAILPAGKRQARKNEYKLNNGVFSLMSLGLINFNVPGINAPQAHIKGCNRSRFQRFTVQRKPACHPAGRSEKSYEQG
jgi:hypothetical protein